jgi:hypothetical protein
MGTRRRTIATLGLAGLLAGLASFFAVSPAALADARLDGLARSLTRSPLYVSATLARVVLPGDVTRIRAELRRYHHPAYVVAIPTFGGESDATTVEDLPDILHDRVGRPGLYVAADADGLVSAQAFGVPVHTDLETLDTTTYNDTAGERVGQQLAYAVRLVTTGRRSPVSPPGHTPVVDALEWVAGALGAALAIALVFGRRIAGGVRRRRARAADVRAHAVMRPRRDAAAAGEIDRAATERDARRELASLSAALATADHPPEPAFDCYAAASKVLGEPRPQPVDLLGAWALLRHGHALIDGTHPPRPACFFDPRHPRDAQTTRWRVHGEDITLPACADCARTVRRGRAPRAALDHGEPYYERDTIWARTGFGTLDDGLATDILEGASRR